jgi:hypothetical protein
MKYNYKSLIIAIVASTLSFTAFAEDKKVENNNDKKEEVTAKTPVDEIFKQNYIDLTNWVKQTATDTGKTVGPLINKAGKLAQEQTPLFISDYIRWQIVDNFVVSAVYILIMIVGLYILIKNIRIENAKPKEKSWNEFSSNFLCVVVGMFVSIIFCGPVFFCGTLPKIENGIKALVAPRVVIVEKIHDLVSNKN